MIASAILSAAPPAPRVLPQPRGARPDVAEVGEDKTVAQHAGNAGFAAVSLLGSAAARSRAARMVPGLNFAVGVLEGFNAVSAHRRGEHVAAMGHAGNSVGCAAAFLEDAARLTAAVGTSGMPHAVGGAVIGLGVLGGALGVVQGVHEIRLGRALQRSTGSTRTLKMGIADLASGAMTLAGIGLRLGGLAPGVGTALLVGASACDLASIAVDYLEKHHARTH